MVSGADLVRGWFDNSPYVKLLGLVLVELTPDRAVVEMPFREDLATAGDVVHGGAVSSLIDTASAVAAWSAHDPAQGARWGTASLSVNFLAAGRGTLRATAEVTKRGRTLCFCRISVVDGDDSPVAGGLVTYRLG
jgi:uncharacterized protein (TIGR00369 family)